MHFRNCLIAILFFTGTELYAATGVPMPSITFYGMLVDEFGWPYESNVRFDIQSLGKSIYSRSITPAQGVDYNFLVRVPYDSGTGTAAYSANALLPGADISVKVVALATGSVLINTNLVVSFQAGAVFIVNLTAGTDSLGDGIPDELRRWIWQNTGTGLFDPSTIRALGDADFDGVSNLDEYHAGTDPANFDDVFRVEVSDSGVADVGKLTFYTVPGKTYKIHSSDLKPDSLWAPTNFANSPSSSATQTEFRGTGHYVSLFVPSNGVNTYFRVSVDWEGTSITRNLP